MWTKSLAAIGKLPDDNTICAMIDPWPPWRTKRFREVPRGIGDWSRPVLVLCWALRGVASSVVHRHHHPWNNKLFVRCGTSCVPKNGDLLVGQKLYGYTACTIPVSEEGVCFVPIYAAEIHAKIRGKVFLNFFLPPIVRKRPPTAGVQYSNSNRDKMNIWLDPHWIQVFILKINLVMIWIITVITVSYRNRERI